MSETLEQIEGQVRDKVDTTVAQAREALDLRRHVSERPWLALGAASLLGYVVGGLGGADDSPPPRPAPGQPMRYYAQPTHAAQQNHTPEDHAAGSAYAGQHNSSGRGSQMMGAMAQVADPIREELSLMAVAAVRSAMRVLRETLQDSIPQFDREYQSVQRERDEGDGTAQAEVGGFGPRPGVTPPL
jgi:hypothetical protein